MTSSVNQRTPKLQKLQPGLDTILKAIAALVIISIFLKVIIDIDTNYDT